jgi:hypothetical protein
MFLETKFLLQMKKLLCEWSPRTAGKPASSLDGVQRNPGLRITLVFHFCYVIGGNGQYGFDAPYSKSSIRATRYSLFHSLDARFMLGFLTSPQPTALD